WNRLATLTADRLIANSKAALQRSIVEQLVVEGRTMGQMAQHFRRLGRCRGWPAYCSHWRGGEGKEERLHAVEIALGAMTHHFRRRSCPRTGIWIVLTTNHWAGLRAEEGGVPGQPGQLRACRDSVHVLQQSAATVSGSIGFEA